MPTVAILGRPNVGKSTLFNRLCGLRVALVDATPGVTRDRRSGLAKLGDLEFDVIDTGRGMTREQQARRNARYRRRMWFC